MEAPPTTDTVYQSVLTLYNNPDTNEKEKASKWLDSLQKSVSKIDFSYGNGNICYSTVFCR